MIEKMKLESQDVAAQKREELKQLFPSVFTEAKNEKGELVESVDFEKLKALVGEFSDVFESRRERYGMDWPGKKECMTVIQRQSSGALKPKRSESVNFDSTKNVFIEGDNLEVIKLLQKSYYGKVKMIYIDPPYNTGNEFVYPDNFTESLSTYLSFAGLVNDEGKKFSSNSGTEGRFHTKWMNMMFSRMYLARNLLSEDGVICVSIDDHEITNLRKILDEVFGEENFVATICWQKRYVSNVTAKWLSDMHDFVVVYARKKSNVEVNSWDRTEEQLKAYKNPDNDTRGSWRAQDLSASKPYSAGQFEITGPTGKLFNPPPNRYWRCNKKQFDEWQRDNRIWWGVNRDARPMLKAFLSESERGITPHTWWTYEFAGHNKEATLEMKKLFSGDSPFDTPKPVKLLKRLLELFCSSTAIVMDFFAGSAPFAQAVLEKQLDGMDCSFLCVQLPEPTEREDYATIADIAFERIKLAIEQSREKHEAKETANSQLLNAMKEEVIEPDFGVRKFVLDKSSFTSWQSDSTESTVEELETQLELAVDHICPGATTEEILFELLLKAGRELNQKIEERKLVGGTLFSIEEDSVVICLEDEITQELLDEVVKLEPIQFICLDKAFQGNDQLKANAVQTFSAHNHGRDKADQIIFRTV